MEQSGYENRNREQVFKRRKVFRSKLIVTPQRTGHYHGRNETWWGSLIDIMKRY